MKAGVIGHPIGHSKSPLIHQYWLDQYHIEGSYEAIHIAPEDLKEGVQKLINEGFDGFNITIPHKQNIMTLCDEVDVTAQAIGAVNTVLIKDKKLYGTNTDAFGFIQNIKQTQFDFDLKNKTAFVLGAGGASRAVIYGLLQEGIQKIIIANRTKEKAKILANDLGDNVEILEWKARHDVLSNIDLLVNTTVLGMTEKTALELSLEDLKPETLVCDIVYTPLITELLKSAKERGNPIVTGIGMLLHQARPAFECWTGIMPNVTAKLETLVLK